MQGGGAGSSLGLAGDAALLEKRRETKKTEGQIYLCTVGFVFVGWALMTYGRWLNRDNATCLVFSLTL